MPSAGRGHHRGPLGWHDAPLPGGGAPPIRSRPSEVCTLNTFTADASASLPGPSWLVQRRNEAWERLQAVSLPAESEEVWRYSGIDAFDPDAFEPPAATDAAAAGDLELARSTADGLGRRSSLVVTRNGSLLAVEGPAPGVPLASGTLTVAGVGEVGSERWAQQLGALAVPRDAFGLLHQAYLPDATVVAVAAKAALSDPVVVVHLVDPGAATSGAGRRGPAVFPHLLVAVGAQAHGGVVELLVTQAVAADTAARREPNAAAQGPALVVPVTELFVADGATLDYANLQVLGSGCWQVAAQASQVGRDATLRSLTAGLGGHYARVRTDSDLVGEGGSTALLAAYLGTDRQVHDFRTLQDHHAPRTFSELLFKGAVADTARSVYSGLIRMRHGARRADARQTNHNLVLSEGARADSVPNLDILENDVRCSHASTVGPIDEEQRYYLESRGIPPAVAERLVVLGFFADLADRSPFPGVARWVERTVAERLAGRLAADDADVAPAGRL